MKRTWGFFPLALLVVSLFPITGAAATAEKSASEELAALVKEVETKRQEFSKIYSVAKTDAERQKAMEKYPQPAQFSERFAELAKKHPKDPAAVDALIWIVQNDSYGSNLGTALDILLRDHVQSDKLATVCSALVYSDQSKSTPALRQILEKNPNREVRGQACLALGQILKRSERADEAEKLLEQVARDFADLKWYRGTLGEQAKAELFELHNLGIGKVAPDIEGEDIDGNKFKLSEYRGKVVVIDFWGDW